MKCIGTFWLNVSYDSKILYSKYWLHDNLYITLLFVFTGAAASRGSPSPISRLHRRKLSEPINNNNNNNQSHEAATATLEETLNGLQKVSDMLQASLKDLEGDETER